MAKTIVDIQNEIFAEINDPANKIHLEVQKKELDRDEYLKHIKTRCLNEGATEEEANDVCLLVDKSLWGFGVIDFLVNDDDTVSDIRLIDEKNIRIKRLGKREKTNFSFASKEEYLKYIEFITNRNNTNMSSVNARQVFVDKDSSPTNILRFTLASSLLNTSEVPTLLIRKIPKKKKDFANLISSRFLTAEQRDYFVKRWKDGHGMLVCGPNGSGKTTFMNALLECTPHTKSVVVMQESEELFCDSHPEMIFRRVIPKRSNALVSYDLKDLGQLALMESFDIMVVGEIKGGEAANLAYATYTGSQAMTSVHSISARDGYEKIIDYALAENPERSREYFLKQFQALDTIVFIKDYCVHEVVELVKDDSETSGLRFTVPAEFQENSAPVASPEYKEETAWA